ncbi:Kae1-like domain-containing protein, partial [Streptomyces acidiscabies]
ANRLLLTGVRRRLHAQGLRVLVGSQVPVGDGGISYGQAAVAAARLTDRR